MGMEEIRRRRKYGIGCLSVGGHSVVVLVVPVEVNAKALVAEVVTSDGVIGLGEGVVACVVVVVGSVVVTGCVVGSVGVTGCVVSSDVVIVWVAGSVVTAVCAVGLVVEVSVVAMVSELVGASAMPVVMATLSVENLGRSGVVGGLMAGGTSPWLNAKSQSNRETRNTCMSAILNG